MIRCPDCKMLNRVGSLHCGSCGQLLTGTEAAPEVQFKAPVLKPSDTEDAAEGGTPEAEAGQQPGGVPGAQEGDGGPPATQFGAPVEPEGAASPSPSSSHKTVMGMPVIRLDGPAEEAPEVYVPEDATLRGRALSEALESATPSAQAPLPSVETPPVQIQTTAPITAEPPRREEVSRPQIQATAPVTQAPPVDAEAKTPIEPFESVSEGSGSKRRPASKTLFGMRAAELHLGLGRSDTQPEESGGPSLKEAFPALGDTAELKAVRPLPDLGAPPPRKVRKDEGKGVQIQSVASVKGSGPGFAETAVIRAVGSPPPPPDQLVAGETTGAAPTEAEADAVLIPSSPLPAPDVVARAAVALGRVTPKTAARSALNVTDQLAAAPSGRDSGWARGLRLIAGLSLIAASILPLSATIWTQPDLWTGLVPVVLGAVGLVLVFPRRVPTLLALLIGLAGGVLGAFTYLEVDLPFPDGILEMKLRYGLLMGGAVLLFVAGFVSLARPGAQPLAKPPPT